MILHGRWRLCGATRGILFLLLVLSQVMLFPDWSYSETAIIPVRFRNASEMLAIVQNMLSQDGRIAVDVQSNSLVVVDTLESIQNVRAFLEGMDKPVRQARIRLRFGELNASEGRSVSADGRVSGKNWTVTTGRKTSDGVDVRLQDRRVDQQAKSEYFINVASGSWAYISVGKEIPYTQRWIDLCHRYGRVVDTVVIQRIETGMEVKPIIMGDRADVEIMPMISHEVPGKARGVVRFATASTRMSVPLGQWTDIGGSDTESSEVMRAILEAGSGRQQSSLSISFVVEAMN
jgi:hypothetical protein